MRVNTASVSLAPSCTFGRFLDAEDSFSAVGEPPSGEAVPFGLSDEVDSITLLLLRQTVLALDLTICVSGRDMPWNQTADCVSRALIGRFHSRSKGADTVGRALVLGPIAAGHSGLLAINE